MVQRILFVDDEEDVRLLAGVFLREHGYEVREAANGVEALAQLAKHPIDLVVLDLVMPEKEGAETVRAIRRERSDLPVLAISGVVGADFYLHAVKMLGATATLRKPFTREQLIGAIEPLLGRAQV